MLVKKFVDFTLKHIPRDNIKTIIEIGARDCVETLKFHAEFPAAKIYTFECNPQTLPICVKNVASVPNITLIQKAISEKSGTVSFFAIDPEKTETTWEDGNPGASSLFKASGNYPIEKYAQNEITVDSIRAEDFIIENNITSIDLLWMDIQGGELGALKSFGDHLKKVKILHTEVEFMEVYQNQPLFWELKKFLNDNGFYLVEFTSFYKRIAGDAIFINMEHVNSYFEKVEYFITNKTLHLRHHYGIKKL